MLIDLVKAFDRVPRELLWLVMEKQGVPPKLISLLRALHESVKVQFEVDGVTKVMDSIIGKVTCSAQNSLLSSWRRS